MPDPPTSGTGPGPADPGAFERSTGLLLAPFGSGALTFDIVTETAHHLSPTAAWLLSRAGPAGVDDLAQRAAAETGAPIDRVASDLRAGVELLRAQGLVDRRTDVPPPPAIGGSHRQSHGAIGSVHAVLDHRLAFRSPDVELLRDIDAFLGMDVGGLSATLHFDVEPQPDGSICLHTDTEWRFPDRAGLFRQLPGVINLHAARSHSTVVLHAGAVRCPDGRVLLVPGESNAGKSTLVAALVAAGADYLGDESIGVRHGTLCAVAHPKPLTLDAASQALFGVSPPTGEHLAVRSVRPDAVLLAGDVGPIDHVVFARYRPDEPESVEALDPEGGIRALLANTLNLARAGEVGLEALCRLAESVPISRVVHGDARALARRLLADR